MGYFILISNFYLQYHNSVESYSQLGLVESSRVLELLTIIGLRNIFQLFMTFKRSVLQVSKSEAGDLGHSFKNRFSL